MNFPTSEEIAEVFRASLPLVKFKLTQPFGANYTGFYADLGMDGHNGLDLVAPDSTVAYAVCDGKIKFFADRTGGLGMYLYSNRFKIKDQTCRLRFTYYHLKQSLVPDGDILKGQQIALCDNTGRYTTGSHLHFGMKIEILKDGKWIQDRENGYFGSQDPAPVFDDDMTLLPVDRRYGKTRHWLKEYINRFKTKKIHEDFIRYGRSPSSITDRENNAMVYGEWSVKEIVEPAMFDTWSKHEKSFF